MVFNIGNINITLHGGVVITLIIIIILCYRNN